MLDADIDLTCVVVNYKRNDMLARFLESFLYQSTQCELIVMDLCSVYSDEVANLINEIDGAQYWPMENVGYGRACNYAASLSAGNTIAFFNADTVLFDDTLGNCYAALNLHEDWGMLSPAVSTTDGSVSKHGLETKRVDKVSISNFFIKKELWLKATALTSMVWPSSEGAFLPSLYGYEAMYLSKLAQHMGYEITHYGDCLMVHDSVSNGTIDKKVIEEAKTMMDFTLKELGI